MQNKIAALKAKLSGGVTPAMATPLLADGYGVNTAVVPHLVNFLIERGVKGLFAGGSTGEGIVLPLAERKKIHEAAVTAVSGRIPVLIHAGSIRTDWAVELARHAEAIGADAIAAVAPNFYKLDDDSLARYYEAIANAAPDTPLILYDIPHLATNGVSPGLLRTLGQRLPSLAGIKSSRPDAIMVRNLLDAAPDHIVALAGNEAIALGLLALGMDGMLSGLATAVPEPLVALTQAVADSDLAEARRQQTLIRRILAQTPPGQRIGWLKKILSERGVDVGTAVPPRQTPTNPVWPAIEALL